MTNDIQWKRNIDATNGQGALEEIELKPIKEEELAGKWKKTNIRGD